MKVLIIDFRVEEKAFLAQMGHSSGVVAVVKTETKLVNMLFDENMCIDADYDFETKLNALVTPYFAIEVITKELALTLEGDIKNLLNLAVAAGKLHTGEDYESLKGTPGITLLSSDGYSQSSVYADRVGT